LNKSDAVLIKHFISFAQKELKLTVCPPIQFVSNDIDSKKTFGMFNPSNSSIKIRTKDRHPIDIMRTLAHELTHFKQKQNHASGKQAMEDNANAMAGRIMRKYDQKYGNVFKTKPLNEDGAIAGAAEPAAANHTGVGVPGTGDDPVTWKKKKPLNAILKRKAV
jgi:phage gpG-like protein